MVEDAVWSLHADLVFPKIEKFIAAQYLWLWLRMF